MDRTRTENNLKEEVRRGIAPSDVSRETLTILMPAYNEQEIIAGAVKEWYTEVVTKLPNTILLVVDDCSTDGTESVLAQLVQTMPGVEYLRRMTNGGHGQAILFGFQNVRTEFVFQTDSDRQHRPDEFWRLWELRDKCDFVMGVRAKRQDGGFRRVVTTLMRVLNLTVWQVWISDANCPFKLMRKKPLQTVLARIPQDAFIPMVMVSILSRRMGFRVAEVPVTHIQRRGGTQSLRGAARWVRVGLLCARQLVRLRIQMTSRFGNETF
jgi:glycosyltransferase involved in cell wall biosynthesis